MNKTLLFIGILMSSSLVYGSLLECAIANTVLDESVDKAPEIRRGFEYTDERSGEQVNYTVELGAREVSVRFGDDPPLVFKESMPRELFDKFIAAVQKKPQDFNPKYANLKDVIQKSINQVKLDYYVYGADTTALKAATEIADVFERSGLKVSIEHKGVKTNYEEIIGFGKAIEGAQKIINSGYFDEAMKEKRRIQSEDLFERIIAQTEGIPENQVEFGDILNEVENPSIAVDLNIEGFTTSRDYDNKLRVKIVKVARGFTISIKEGRQNGTIKSLENFMDEVQAYSNGSWRSYESFSRDPLERPAPRR